MSTDLTGAADKADTIELDITEGVEALTPEQREQLSASLFPDTHTDKVMVLGKERLLRPLPIKYSKQINVLLSSFQKMVAASQSGVAAEAIEIDLLTHVVGVCGVLAKFYEWEDVQAALDEEEMQLKELQSLIVHQVHLQEMNDFLLMPLRVLVGVMQQSEIAMIRLQSIFSGLV